MSEPAVGEIYKLMPKIMGAVGAVAKTRNNQQQNYKFRGIDEIYKACQSVMAEHNVFCVPIVEEQKREDRPTRDGKGVLFYTILTVRYTFFAPDGSHVEAMTVGEAMDSGDKSSNKAMSAAQKYALIQVFCIPTEGDNDSENRTPQPGPKRETVNQQTGEVIPEAPKAAPPKQPPVRASKQQVDELISLLDRVPEETLTKWLNKAHITRWEDMPADKCDQCIAYAKKLPKPTEAAQAA